MPPRADIIYVCDAPLRDSLKNDYRGQGAVYAGHSHSIMRRNENRNDTGEVVAEWIYSYILRQL